MLGKEGYFHNRSIRNSTAAFLTLFNDIYIARSVDGQPAFVPVSVAYGPSSKYFIAGSMNQQDRQTISRILPAISVEATDLTYDKERQVNQKEKILIYDENGVQKGRVNAPSPYLLGLNVYIKAKTLGDGWQIVEQIIPLFRPTHYIRMRELPRFPSFISRLGITLDGIQWSDEYQGDFNDKREIEWTLTFKMQINIWSKFQWIMGIKDPDAPNDDTKASDEIGGPIKTIELNMRDADETSVLYHTVGLWEDGEVRLAHTDYREGGDTQIWILTD